MGKDEIMTVEEVARYLKMKPQTVYKWAQEGRIPAAKLGREWRFRRGILDEWIDTSLLLSKGGFDLIYQSSALTAAQHVPSEKSVGELIAELERE